jgi:hypothetical protein
MAAAGSIPYFFLSFFGFLASRPPLSFLPIMRLLPDVA